jgi:hypothetical protein
MNYVAKASRAMRHNVLLSLGILLLLVGTPPVVHAQRPEICGTPSIPYDLAAEVENFVQQFGPFASKIDKIRIPVAFHVVYSGNSGRVGDAQIAKLIQNLNSSFQGTPFSFYLQRTDRTNNSTWYANCGLGTVNDQQMKESLARDPRHVLNIYSCIPGATLIGFASFPFLYPESSFLHGVNLHPRVLPGGGHPDYGTSGDAGVHEVGHYLGLFHIFEGGCSDGDLVDDTPAQGAPHYGCPPFVDTCPNAIGQDDVHNFMDYSNDQCMRHFTQGQISRMTSQAQIFRPSLGLAGCFLDLPSPRLVISGTEPYVVRGKKFTRYLLKVANSSSFPDALFSRSKQPCGLSKTSSRSWVHILDEQGRGLYGFCGLRSSGELNITWFAVAQGQTPPSSVYMIIEDRQCGITYQSDLIPVPR